MNTLLTEKKTIDCCCLLQSKELETLINNNNNNLVVYFQHVVACLIRCVQINRWFGSDEKFSSLSSI